MKGLQEDKKWNHDEFEDEFKNGKNLNKGIDFFELEFCRPFVISSFLFQVLVFFIF